MVALKDESNIRLVQFIPLLHIQLVYRLIEKVVLPRPRAIQHPDNAQQRRFAGPRGPHNGDELTLSNVDAHPPQQEKLVRSRLDGLLQIPQLNQRFHKFSFSDPLTLQILGLT